MSAITGLIYFDNDFSAQHQGEGLMDDLRHLPADQVSSWHHHNVYMGCRTQWITPESLTERLPYYDSSRDLTITADVILDNREELYDKLHIDFAIRQQITDSKLILLAYAKWGQDCPRHLIGDFAFMIWDGREHTLFGARDFSGSRTLYFAKQSHGLAFCSLIQPLLQLPGVNGALNEMWLAEFLALSGMNEAVDMSTTPYLGVAQLPPSHTIMLQDGRLCLKRYTSFSAIKKLKLKSNDEYVEAFQEVFQQAVTARLRTYRQVGAQLSGGLDSGAIVGFAAKHLQEKQKTLHTFTYVPTEDFEDYTAPSCLSNERPLVQSTIDHVGGIEAEFCDFAERNSYHEMDSFLDTMEMPYKFFENSFWLSGMFERASAKNVGVLLNGGRGNLSISWGSAFDYYSLLLKRLRWIRLTHELNCYSQQMNSSRFRHIPMIARKAFPILQRWVRSESFVFPTIINADFAHQTKVYEKLKDYGIGRTGWFASNNIYEHRHRHFEDLFHWNASNTFAAKSSLQHSVWKRDPSNDLRVIQFCLSLPEEQYVQDGIDRVLIRRATKHVLPDQVRLNQRTRGVQGADWVHRMLPHWQEFMTEAEELCSNQQALSYLYAPNLKAALQKARHDVKPHYAVAADSKVLMRSMIVNRFLQKIL